jgi:hypothetical protein
MSANSSRPDWPRISLASDILADRYRERGAVLRVEWQKVSMLGVDKEAMEAEQSGKLVRVMAQLQP